MSSNSKINKLQGRALIVPETVNVGERTVEVVFATETPVFRFGWVEDYNEVLVCDEKSVRKDRIDKGLPVIDSHNSYELKSQIGRTTDVRFEGAKGIATVKLSNRKDVDGIFQDIKDGIIRDISVGYRVYKYEKESPEISGKSIPTYRAIDWSPFEISFVSVPADANCGVRSNQEPENEVEIISINTNSIRQMEEITCPECGHVWETDTGSTYTCPECGDSFEESRKKKDEGCRSNDTPPAPAPIHVVETPTVSDVASIRSEATKEQKSRLNAILLSSRTAKLNDSIAIELYLSEKTVDECRQEIIKKMAVNNAVTIDGNNAAIVGIEAIDKKRAAVINAVLNRVAPKTFKLESGNEFRGMTLTEIAREILQERGFNVRGKSKIEIADMVFGKRAHSTSDFGTLFEEAINKMLRADYQFAPEFWEQIAKQTTVTDFRQRNLYQVDSVNGMVEIPEGGEITYTTMKESKSYIKIAKYGEGIRFTREAFINDDLNALSVIPSKFVKDWNEKRGDLVWGMIINNIVMPVDGNPLFHTSHLNIATGALTALSDTSLETANTMFSKWTSISGRRIRVVPSMLVVPTELQYKAQRLMTQVTPSNIVDINIWANKFSILVEQRLADPDAWYLFASPSAIEGLIYAYLDGNDGLRVNQEENFNTDTMDYRVRSEFGVAAGDYRGLLKMTGK